MRRERRQPGGGKLDCEWDTVEPAYQLSQDFRVCGCERKVCPDCASALDQKLHRLAAADRAHRGGIVGAWDSQARHAPDALTGYDERLATGRQDGQAWTGSQKVVDKCRGGREEMFAVVEDHKPVLPAQVCLQRLRQRLPSGFEHANGLSGRVQDETGITQSRELDQPAAVFERIGYLVGDTQGESRLTDSAGSGECQQADATRQQQFG